MLSLLLTALIWGFAFVAQVQGMDSMSPMFFNAARFTLGALSLVPILLWMRGRGSADKGDTAGADVVGTEASVAVSTDAASNGASDVVTITGAKLNANKPDSAVARLLANPVVISVICGIVLFAADNCQQAGISSYPPEAAASGRAGFLTAVYVVIVALLARFMGRKLHPAVVAAVFVCLAGMYLLCVPLDQGFSGVYLGDVIMLAGALFYSLHILAVGRFALEDALWLSAIQFCTSAALSSACALAVEGATPLDALPALLPILYVGIFSTGLGYTLQNIGQRTVDEAPAAILMSLESVFAALGGWALLGESMSGAELAGCALVFAAVLLAQLPQFKRARSS